LASSLEEDHEETHMAEKQRESAEIELDASDAAERKTLIWVLAINLFQVIVAGGVGVIADSTGLLGAALDNLGDAGVYAISLYAVGRTATAKVRVARLSGMLLITLGLGLLVEVLRRFFAGAEPIGFAMIAAALANAALNVVCLRLLRSHRDRGVHLKASWIFTTNDMLANGGIVVSGVAVMYLASPLPDLIIGLVVGVIVLKGGWEILGEARVSERENIMSSRD
jgi:Co/Zn/Cd efflux system component